MWAEVIYPSSMPGGGFGPYRWVRREDCGRGRVEIHIKSCCLQRMSLVVLLPMITFPYQLVIPHSRTFDRSCIASRPRLSQGIHQVDATRTLCSTHPIRNYPSGLRSAQTAGRSHNVPIVPLSMVSRAVQVRDLDIIPSLRAKVEYMCRQDRIGEPI